MSCTRRPGPPGAVTWTRTADCVAETAVFGQLANDSADFLLCLSWAEHQHQKPSFPGGLLRTCVRTTCAPRGRGREEESEAGVRWPLARCGDVVVSIEDRDRVESISASLRRSPEAPP